MNVSTGLEADAHSIASEVVKSFAPLVRYGLTVAPRRLRDLINFTDSVAPIDPEITSSTVTPARESEIKSTFRSGFASILFDTAQTFHRPAAALIPSISECEQLRNGVDGLFRGI